MVSIVIRLLIMLITWKQLKWIDIDNMYLRKNFTTIHNGPNMIVIGSVLVLSNTRQTKLAKTKNYNNSLRWTTHQYCFDYARNARPYRCILKAIQSIQAFLSNTHRIHRAHADRDIDRMKGRNVTAVDNHVTHTTFGIYTVIM